MIPLREIVNYLEGLAPRALQESYDNSGLQVGDPGMEVKGILVVLDVNEEILLEAEKLGFNLVLSHHPVIFGGLKSLTDSSGPERIVKMAIQKEIAIYSGHTNFDAITGGVNTALANRLGLLDQQILAPLSDGLKKIVVYVPHAQLEKVRQAMFDAGAGHIGDYDQCSFNSEGEGTFRGSEETQPFVGEKGKFHVEKEIRVETILPAHLENKVIHALLNAHPYEEVAYDVYPLTNQHNEIGAGMIGKLEKPLTDLDFLKKVKDVMKTGVIRHTKLTGEKIDTIAVCGGSGSQYLAAAIAQGAGMFITGDIKYHQFFDAENKIVIADIGHYESEQFTTEIFCDLLIENLPTFAIHLSKINTNPVNYY